MRDSFAVTLSRVDGYKFEVDFGVEGVPRLLVDEPAPLGEGAGPNPTRMLAAAVGNCLAASLLFCLSKARVEVSDIKVRVEGTTARNERGRLRVEGLAVTLEPTLPAGATGALNRCSGLFKDFCIVTQSVRDGLDVDVQVKPVVAVRA